MTQRGSPAAHRQERIAYVAILGVIAAYIGFGLKTASNSLGCDFSAYYGAAVHWANGQPIYDLATTSTGSCGTYQYPPPFVLLAAPFSLFGFDLGNWLWIGFLIGCWALGTAILPVRASTRWTILLLGAVGWPLIFGVRIGQVAPILYLAFAYAWRNLDRPIPLGVAIAVGGLLKLQPGLLAVWLLARREWRALATTIGVGLAVVAFGFVVGLRDWAGMLTLLRSLTDAVTVPTNLALGATLHTLGMDAGLAGAIQTVNTGAVFVLVVAGALWLPRVPGFLVAIVATQLISPILWSHYALVLLLPVAWLLDRRQWWAVIIPAAEAWILIPFVTNWSYTLAFYVVFAALFVVGWRDRRAVADERTSAAPTSPRVAEPAG
jgi:alpha-1,2-mannosyltransferase